MLSILIIFIVVVVLCVAMEFGSRYFHKKQMKANPLITQKEYDIYRAKLAGASLPMAEIRFDGDGSHGPADSRIGGRPYCDDTYSAWPHDGFKNRPMLFLAQINFSDLPLIEDFPEHGLLQLFAMADTDGRLKDTQMMGTRTVRWFPTPDSQKTLDVPKDLLSIAKNGTLSKRAVTDGLPIRFEKSTAGANPYIWPFIDIEPDWESCYAETPELQSKLDNLEHDHNKVLTSYGTHWVGGHPSFTQEDVRQHDSDLRSLDRVLLHLGFDSDICLGDAGELNLMISQADLRDQKFEKAFCTWDCT